MTYAEQRQRLLEELRDQGVRDERILLAIGRAPRERFLPPELAARAYENTSLPIGLDQTISQPIVVANMTEALALTGGERVLEIGTGSGYQAAVLAEMGVSVTSVERVPALRERAAALLAELGYAHVAVHQAEEQIGWAAGAPYDRIIVTAAGPSVPMSLLDQLAVGGRLVMPVGSLRQQRLVVIERTAGGVDVSDLGRVRFVPLIGSEAWTEQQVSADRASDPEEADSA
ncbi:MAG: protein-L-isoaspartate(D-aspartate) O-methyltransferase [Chloroflexi bacterium]|nr:protein-L-isoaspartate(D-aspartate) O-methyltransferase [Chloroflexota bacterium]